MDTQPTVQELIHSLKQASLAQGTDLSSDEDLSIAVMNLISIEEHLFFTGNKTGKSEYFDYIEDVRSIRKQSMQALLPQTEGETWCISKHLLAASMRLMEVGTKKMSLKDSNAAQRLFDQSYRLYTLFWSIRLNVGIQKIPSDQNNTPHSTPTIQQPREISPKEQAVKEFVNKLVNCCGE